MWDNNSLTTLDLSRCNMDDLSGAYLGRMLKHNTSLIKLEAGSNRLGPKTLTSLADSLAVSQSNPIQSLYMCVCH